MENREILIALAAEAKRRGTSYGKLVGSLHKDEVDKLIKKSEQLMRMRKKRKRPLAR